FGTAFIGNIGTSDIRDFTALGDVVNTASRLQARADAGHMVLSDRVYARVQERYPDAEPVTLEVRGRAEPVAAHVIGVGAIPVAS
ncbi:MAG: adenylate/guanylate cyclase domain-containing protein, partial [Gaiellaceae bacterium]